MTSPYTEWEKIYRENPIETLGWELGKPRLTLVQFFKSAITKRGKALDLCCGAGTNTVFIATHGFEVTGIDVSRTAIGYAKAKAKQNHVTIDFEICSFVDLPFSEKIFDFILDIGCFHHVEPADRPKFVQGVHQVMRQDAAYLLTCFSDRNGPGWNHFSRKQLQEVFSNYFNFEKVRHYGSIEGDGATRYFYTILMKKRK